MVSKVYGEIRTAGRTSRTQGREQEQVQEQVQEQKKSIGHFPFSIIFHFSFSIFSSPGDRTDLTDRTYASAD